ncbi:hypothetical protein GCM10009635_31570 [Actinocatenispora thailandica]
MIIGEWARTRGWALAGAAVRAADDPAAVHAAWRSLPPDTVLVVLTPAAAAVLAGELTAGTAPLTAVLP